MHATPLARTWVGSGLTFGTFALRSSDATKRNPGQCPPGIVSPRITLALHPGYVCYSNQIVYNNFPWPEASTEKRHQAVEQAAQAVINVRAKFPGAMPPALRVAHTTLDRAVDTAYGKRRFDSDAARVAYLFDLYNHYTAELLPQAPKQKRSRRKKPL